MDLILVRHGPAEDRDVFARTGRPDGERPLTGRGRHRTRRAAAGLASLLAEPPRVFTSPLVRARETAALVAEACGAPALKALPALRPGGRRDRRGQNVGRSGTVILVGHEPDMGRLLAWLVAGHPDPFHHFKKAGMAAVRCDTATAGAGDLLWILPPGVLRSLGR